jgi:hypothetical protein
VDHLREDFPTADPLDEESLARFREANAENRARLQGMTVKEQEAIQL